MANAEKSVTEKPAVNMPAAITLEMILGKIEELTAKVEELSKGGNQGGGRGNRQSQREMTDDDARQVLGELAALKHNEAADKLGLSYGQVYSCRLGYTFKHIRKELEEAKVDNQWLKKDHRG